MELHEVYIIGLYGYQRSGKSTVAEMIVEQFPGRTLVVPFSKLLKEICQMAFPDGIQSQPMLTRRGIWQKTASALKAVYPNIFIEHTQKVISNAQDKYVIVIPDLRHNEEKLFIEKANHSTIYKLNKDIPEEQEDGHESEVDWKTWNGHTEINNNSDKNSLYEEVRLKVFPEIPNWVFEKDVPNWKIVKESEIGLPGDFFIELNSEGI